jgi:CzcA family heavy metal efflux pump
MNPGSEVTFVTRHNRFILFMVLALCLGGVYAAYRMPSSVFPQTDFPRVVILVDNGVMPADEMMATITRPIEEAMKDTPGSASIRSATGRGSAEVNVFFRWGTDMVQAELYVRSHLSQIMNELPPTAEFQVQRLTFSSFPIIGVSLTSKTRNITELWEMAEYDIKPQFLRIAGVARVNLVGGREPEYHVVIDPAKLEARHLTAAQVCDALNKTNLFVPSGMHEENSQLYLTLVDGRVHNPKEIGDIPVAFPNDSPVYIRDVATVAQGAAPKYNIVTADGVDAVLLNVRSQPDGNTLAIAEALKSEMAALRRQLPPDVHMAFFYDQSVFVREGVRSVWESIIFGIMLSVAVMYLFLRSVRMTLAAVISIPATLFITLLGMHALGMSFNLMTLGGIAAAIGLIIDDAIVVVEAIHTKVSQGLAPSRAVGAAMREVGRALVGSTITPVVVFVPLAYLDGVPGVFFRALALTMVCSLLISLALSVTLIPTMGVTLIRHSTVAVLVRRGDRLGRVIQGYEWAMRRALRHTALVMAMFCLVVVGAVGLYMRLDSDFLPSQDEGAFVLDYFSRPGTSLSETDRMLRHVEEILQKTPEVESYSRRTGARLALAIAEPNTGDFLVKLRPDRNRTTGAVIDELRSTIQGAEPALTTEFPGILSDLIGDLTWSPEPIEIKIFSRDTETLTRLATAIAGAIEKVPGVVDVNSGLIVAGPSLIFRVNLEEAARAGLNAAQLGANLESALLGTVASHIVEGDRIRNVRVLMSGSQREAEMSLLPVRSEGGAAETLGDVTHIEHQPGLLEMHREDQRQLVSVSGRLSGTDLGTAVGVIREKVSKMAEIPPEVPIEYGGLYQQQQESFKNLTAVLLMAALLVFAVLILEFGTIFQPLAIVAGSALALFGVVGALWITDMSMNIVSFLGAIIGFGIVAKNGILMMDSVEHLRHDGLSVVEALVHSGRRRLRPVLMTSMTAFLGLLPLAYGVGAGADMLKPLAVGVIGALCISLLLSLVATPVVYYVLVRVFTPGALRPADLGGGTAQSAVTAHGAGNNE